MRPRGKSDGFSDGGKMDLHVGEINGPAAIGLYDIPGMLCLLFFNSK